MCRRVVHVRADVSEKRIASIIRVNEQLLVTVYLIPSSSILVTLMMEATRSWESLFLQQPHAITSQKTSTLTRFSVLSLRCHRNVAVWFAKGRGLITDVLTVA
jgi:hypothetical protein